MRMGLLDQFTTDKPWKKRTTGLVQSSKRDSVQFDTFRDTAIYHSLSQVVPRGVNLPAPPPAPRPPMTLTGWIAMDHDGAGRELLFRES